MGEIAYGISAGYGEVRLTIRTWSEHIMEKLTSDLIKSIENVSDNHNMPISYSWTQEFYANQNDDQAVAIIKEAANNLSFDIFERKFPFKWGEDFGLFTQNFNGAMFGIGSGEKSPSLHNPDYDFPDEILPTAIQLFHQISLQIL